MILSLFTRLDGLAYGYALYRAGQDPERHFARNLYETPKEAYPGAQAALAWERRRDWIVPDGFGRTVRDAMGKVGVR
jgi:hypothetical protein